MEDRKVTINSISALFAYSNLLYLHSELLRTQWVQSPGTKAELKEIAKHAERLNEATKKFIQSAQKKQKETTMHGVANMLDSVRIDIVDRIRQRAMILTDEECAAWVADYEEQLKNESNGS